MSGSFVSIKNGVPGPKGDTGSPAGIDDQVHPHIKDRAPSQSAVYDALSFKQDKLSSTDNLSEGIKNLYFTKQRAKETVIDVTMDGDQTIAPNKTAIKIHVAQSISAITTDNVKEGHNKYFDKRLAIDACKPVFVTNDQFKTSLMSKQDFIENSDHIHEGQLNLFHTTERVLNICRGRFAEFGHLTIAAKSKQDKINSSDEIPEGKTNKFFSEDRVIAVTEPAINELHAWIGRLQDRLDKAMGLISEQNDKISELFKQIHSLQRDYSKEVSLACASGNITVISSVSAGGAVYQTFTFINGRISKVSEPSGPKPL